MLFLIYLFLSFPVDLLLTYKYCIHDVVGICNNDESVMREKEKEDRYKNKSFGEKSQPSVTWQHGQNEQSLLSYVILYLNVDIPQYNTFFWKKQGDGNVCL